MSKLSAGDEVVTTAGIYGTVTELEDAETLLLEVAEGTEIRIARAAIAKIIVDVPATDIASDAPAPDGDPDTGTA